MTADLPPGVQYTHWPIRKTSNVTGAPLVRHTQESTRTTIDHILVSEGLLCRKIAAKVVHAEIPDHFDHYPVVFEMDTSPEVAVACPHNGSSLWNRVVLSPSGTLEATARRPMLSSRVADMAAGLRTCDSTENGGMQNPECEYEGMRRTTNRTSLQYSTPAVGGHAMFGLGQVLVKWEAWTAALTFDISGVMLLRAAPATAATFGMEYGNTSTWNAVGTASRLLDPHLLQSDNGGELDVTVLASVAVSNLSLSLGQHNIYLADKVRRTYPPTPPPSLGLPGCPSFHLGWLQKTRL